MNVNRRLVFAAIAAAASVPWVLPARWHAAERTAPVDSRPTAADTATSAPHLGFTLPPWPQQEAILANIRARFDASPSVGLAVHYVRLRDVVGHDDPRIEQADRILRGFATECAPIVATRSGARYREHEHKVRPTAAEESHVGQALAVLAEIGVGSDAEILVGRETQRLADVVADLVANYYPRRFDVEWTAVALATYWPTDRWTNRFDESSSFDSLASELMEREPFRQSCGGTHLLQALACILLRKADSLQPATAQRARAYISAALDAREDSDRTRLHITWQDGVPRLRRDRGPSLLVTGHLVEFLLTSSAAFGGTRQPTRESITWLQSELMRYSASIVPEKDICEVTHAFRAVSLARTLCGHVDHEGRRK
jgi:hypothetical protein